MKKNWIMMAALLTLALGASACEEQEKKAQERGKIPQELVNKAKQAEQQVQNAVKSMEEGLNQATSEQGNE